MRPERPEPPIAPPDQPGPEGEQRWMPWTAPIALLTALMVAFVGGLVVSVVAVAFGAEIDDLPPGVLMVATLIQDVGFIGAAIFFARTTGPVFAYHFGLRATRVARAVGLLLAIYFAYGLFAGAWSE